jgi:hypothetical protein
MAYINTKRGIKVTMFLASTLILVTACEARNIYDQPPTDISDNEFNQTLKAIEAEGRNADSFLYLTWATKELAIKRKMLTDSTPDITPTTIAGAIEEQRERNRREKLVGVVNRVKTACRMKHDGLNEDFQIYPKGPYEINGESYGDPCDALARNDILLD